MAILTIGRIGLDVTLSDPQGFDERTDGEQVSLSIRGQIKNASTLAQAQAVKEELLAQVGRVVPVTYTTDSAINGFYVLTSASVNTDRQYAPYSNYLFPFTAELARIDSPTWELAYTGGLMPNAHTIAATADKGMLAIPVTFTWAADPSGATTSAVLSCDGDDVRIYYALDPGDSGPEYAIAPGDFYDAACEVWVDSRLRAGSNRRLPAFTTVRLNNYLVRVDVGTGVAGGDIDIAHYADGAWQTAKTYNLRWEGVAGENSGWVDCFIVRNDPEEVSVQFVKPRATIGYLAMTITLRRGWRTVLVTLFTDGAIDCGVNRKSAEAATALTVGASTYGIVATAADGNGDKYLILSPQALTTVDLATTAGVETSGNAGQVFLGISLVVNSAAPDTGAAQADLVDQFFNWLEAQQVRRGVTV